MAYWLVKSEPSAWSWSDHWNKPGRIEPWNGVRNHQAANAMRQMKVGDRSFFYESVKQPGIVGILKVTRSFYPDPTDKTGKFGMVDFKAIKPLPRKLALAELRSHEAVAELALFRQSRLSVMPVPAKVWAYLIDLAARPG